MNSKIEDLKQWLNLTVKLLVDKPEKVKIDVIEGMLVSVITVQSDREDAGKLIGKQGIMADALRTFLNAYAGRIKSKFVLHIEK